MGNYKLLIKRIVLDFNDHLSAEQIYFKAKQVAPKISLASVYNNLKTLVNSGEIKKLPFSELGDRYDNLTPHAHLVCAKCKKITDVNLDGMTEYFSSKLGVKTLNINAEISYLCDDCKNKLKEKYDA